jgi:hypothetical protein
MNLLAVFVGKNATDDIASASDKWAPTVHPGSERYTVINCIMLFLNGVYAVSRCNLSLYSTSQICMQCLTDLIIFLVAVQSIFKNPHSALLYRYFRQSLESEYPAFQFRPPCWIHNVRTPDCSRLWSLPKMNVSWFVIWTTLHCKSSSMLGGFQ